MIIAHKQSTYNISLNKHIYNISYNFLLNLIYLFMNFYIHIRKNYYTYMYEIILGEYLWKSLSKKAKKTIC